jgi:hypothetical protein
MTYMLVIWAVLAAMVVAAAELLALLVLPLFPSGRRMLATWWSRSSASLKIFQVVVLIFGTYFGTITYLVEQRFRELTPEKVQGLTGRQHVVGSIGNVPTDCIGTQTMGNYAVGFWPPDQPIESYTVVKAYRTFIVAPGSASSKPIGFTYRTNGGHWVYQTRGFSRTSIGDEALASVALMTGAWAEKFADLPDRISEVAAQMESRNLQLPARGSDFVPGTQVVLEPCRSRAFKSPPKPGGR